MNRRIVFLTLAVVAMLLFAGCIQVETSSNGEAASDYPSKPITMLIPYSAGGGTDTQGRALAAVMEEELGQPINVVNVAGGGGTVGVQELLAADPDGYTILGSTTTAIITNRVVQGLEYKVEDFAFAGTTGLFQAAMVVARDAPYDTWDDFVAYAKENPGTKWYSLGQAANAAMQTMADAEGLEIAIIPGSGAPTVLPTLESGDADISFSGGIHARFAETGELKVLLNMRSTGPLLAHPDAPAAFDRYGVAVDNAMVVVAPAGIPEDVLSALSAAVEVAANSDSYAEIMDVIKYPALYINAEESATLYAEQEIREQETLGK